MTKTTRTPQSGGGAANVPFGPAGGGGSMSIPVLETRNLATLIVPPGGFVAFGSQTPATQEMFRRAGRLGGTRSAAKRRRTKKKRAAAPAARRRRRSTKRPARLVKGSAAAKRYMASIRKRRKR